MKFECTGVILAGGKNRRLPGKKKAFRTVGDRMILEKIYDVFSTLFCEVIIVVNEPEQFAGWDMTVVTDIHPSGCALAGLHTGLFYASFPHAYVTACDTPFINPQIIKHLVNKISPRCEVIVPRTIGGLEPLSAVYSKRCIPLMEENLEKNIFMIKKSFKSRKVMEVPIDELRPMDGDLRFAFNINTPQDLETAKQMIGDAPENLD